jgi:hypothetical protein
MEPDTKPLVTAALVCEKVLQEKDGVLSAVRIVDTYIQRLPKEAPEVIASIITPTLLVSLKSGDFEGKGVLKVSIQTPSGKINPMPQDFPLLFKGGHHGQNVIVNIGVESKMEGVYWFLIDWNGELLARTPLKLIREEAPEPTKDGGP